MLDQSPWEKLSAKLSSQKILILGLGRQGGGVQVANTCVQAGAKVRVTDLQTETDLAASVAQLDSQIEKSLGGHRHQDIEWADLIIKNPAVPQESEFVQLALKLGKTVTGEVALALKIVRDQTVGITGTRGKTTTTNLVYQILNQHFKDVVLAGNIPERPFLAQLQSATDQTWFVVEVSSFQTELLPNFAVSPHVAVLTSLSPDHFNRYATVEEYYQAKLAMFVNQQPGDLAFWNSNSDLKNTIQSSLAAGVKPFSISADTANKLAQQFPSSLNGQHNQQNIALAVRVAQELQVPNDVIALAVANFKGVAYRQEVVGQIDGLSFVNDTTATTPTALEVALQAYQDQPLVLICGGASKKLPLDRSFLTMLATKPRAIVFLEGEGQQEIASAWQKNGIEPPDHSVVATSLERAFQHAVELAQQEQTAVVLLSPGFASFDLFKNEFDRGDQFNSLVNEYLAKHS